MSPPGRGRPPSPGRSLSPGGSPSPLAVVLAGGRSRRMGSPKAVVPLGGRPLVLWALAAAAEAGLDAVVVAKPGVPLPPLEVPVWTEPEEPVHPACGLVAALERAAPRAVIALACDMPFVPPALLAELAALDAVAAHPPGEAFPARYAPAALPVLRAGLAREAPLRELLDELRPATVAVDEPARALLGINDPAALARAEAALR